MRRRTSNPGFTIIEAIACIVLLAVLIPPSLWAVRESQIQRVNPVLSSRARWLVTEKLEEVIADRHSDSRGYDHLEAGNYPGETVIAGVPGFTRAVTFFETNADLTTPGTGYLHVTVTVSWMDAGGTPRELAMSTVVTEYE